MKQVTIRAINTDGQGIHVEKFNIPERVGMDVIVRAPYLEVDDGFHTMSELYDHRYTLFIALCRVIQQKTGRDCTWRSRKHDDGTMFPDMYILGINEQEGEQITYHLPLTTWDETHFAKTLDNAPHWDKHTSRDVLQRLMNL